MKQQVLKLAFVPSIVIFAFTCTVRAQVKNDFLNRGFWKEKPSLETVQQKIDLGHSIHEMNEHAMDATSYAILEGNPLETVVYLIEQGLNVNKPTHDKRTYIFWAGYKGNLALMEYLIGKGARTDLVDAHGYSLIQFVAMGNATEDIYSLCAHNGNDYLKKDKDGRSLLLLHSQNLKDLSILEFFGNKGMDLEDTDNDGNGIFNYASRSRDRFILEKLVQRGVSYTVNPKTRENAFTFSTRRRHGGGPKMETAFLKYLEGLGLDPATVPTSGRTALHNIALWEENIGTYKYFVDRGCTIDRADEKGDTPLILACYGRNKEIVGYLLEKTKDIDHRNKEGYTALTRAMRTNGPEVVELLIAKGARTQVEDVKGRDLGYHLVDGYRRNIEALGKKMDMLMETGYNPKARQKDNGTLLHLAIKKGKLNLVKYIVGLGVDVDAKNGEGYTALHMAAMLAKDDAIIRYLVESGADRAIKTDMDETVYDLTLENELLQERKMDLTYLTKTK